jgi:hypothetical protein
VDRAQGKNCMQGSRFIQDSLEEKRVPEGQDEEAWDFLHGSAREPLVVALLLCARCKDGNGCRWC